MPSQINRNKIINIFFTTQTFYEPFVVALLKKPSSGSQLDILETLNDNSQMTARIDVKIRLFTF